MRYLHQIICAAPLCYAEPKVKGLCTRHNHIRQCGDYAALLIGMAEREADPAKLNDLFDRIERTLVSAGGGGERR